MLKRRLSDDPAANRWADRLLLADAALGLHPGDPDLLCARGWARRMTGDAPGALRDLDAAIAAVTTDASTWNCRAIVREDLGDLAGALADYDQALRLEPTQPVIFGNRARARLRGGELSGAEADFRAALDARPDDPALWSWLGTTRLLRDDLAGAVAALDSAIATGHADARTWRRRGWARLGQGDREAGLADLRSVFVGMPVLGPAREWKRQEPDDAFGPLSIAALLGETASLPPFAEREDGDGWAARFLLGRVEVAAYVAAAEAVDAPRERRRRLQEAWWYVGLVADREGRIEEARQAYRACVAAGAPPDIDRWWAARRLRELGNE